MSSYTSFSSLALLLLLLPLSLSFYIPDSNPILSLNDQVRERHLYTENHRKGLFLEMMPDGRVRGSPEQTSHSVLELRSVRTGVTVLRGVASSLYLCVDSAGRPRGQSQYSDADCAFREQLLADGYTRFLSDHHGLPVSLASKRSPEQHGLPFTRFLPLRSTLAGEGGAGEGGAAAHLAGNQQHFNLDSDDPLGMGLSSVYSPQFSTDRKR